MKTSALRKFIIASSLGLCALAQAAPAPAPQTDKPVKTYAAEIRVMQCMNPVPTPVLPPVRDGIASSATLCVPAPSGGSGELLPLQMPRPSFSIRELLSFRSDGGGCILRPGKPIRPIPMRPFPLA